LVRSLRDRKVSSFSMELVPRITRAQKMDALSSQASIAGYKAVLLAAAELEEVQSLISYNIAVARLHSVLGTTLTRNNIEFDVENAAD
ncbi:MAG: hypothetical protein AAFY46_05220, partial [Planctomycetota bacterium]